MADITLDEDRLKRLLKDAVVELFEERKDLLRDVFEDVLEDMALSRAIDEGEKTDLVDKEEIFNQLESKQ